ncbi:MAG TPA: hypothetical protein VG167_02815 [Verrucomicrobiae bacterium]|nr:hypothetical protein [Verrucomicrobiae bacterium]
MGGIMSLRVVTNAGTSSATKPTERLRVLRQFRWSSYPGYAGHRPPLAWVCREPLARLCGGSSAEEQTAALRAYTESALFQGTLEPPWARLVDGLVLGSAAFAQRLRREARGNAREQRALRTAAAAPAWAQIVRALEQAKGENWASFAERHGDWGRDAALWLGRRTGRMTLAQLGRATGGLDYAVVSKTLSRFSRRLSLDGSLREQLASLERQLSK